MPSGMPTMMERSSEMPASSRCREVQRISLCVRDSPICVSRGGGAVLKIEIGCARVVPGSFRFRVQLDHALLVQGSFELSQSCDRVRRQRQPIEKHRFVLREELKIVLQHEQIVLADFRVGRVSIFDVDRAIPKGRVAETVIDSRDVLGGEFILLRERPPAIPGD